MINNKSTAQVLSVFSDCIPTIGVKRAIISDLTRNQYYFVPLELVEMLKECRGYSKEQIFQHYGSDNENTIDEYITFLEEKEIIFWCNVDDLKYFPEINLEWKHSSVINNIIIDYNEHSTFNISSILSQIINLNCQYIQFRSFNYKSLDFWAESLKSLRDSQVKGVEIITQWDPILEDENIAGFIENHPRIHSIIFHSSPKIQITQNSNSMGNVIYTIEKIYNNSHCGQIHWNYFNVNINLFTEAQQYNTCLNRKISIDENGNIKNCPSMAKSYGNIKNTTLVEAIEKQGFKDMWFINKDQIVTCKDCEFRYICTDCRAYIENPKDNLSKPLKCGYNPYTAEWEEWSTNPLKQKAIDYYHMKELIKNEK